MYGQGLPSDQREVMLRNSKIAWATCFKKVIIPARSIVRLAQEAFPDDAEPQSFTDALEHWLTVEILCAIGQHSVV